MDAGVMRLNKVLSDAKPGSDQEKLLKQIGLNAEELRRIDPAEALRQVAVALTRYSDDGNKGAVRAHPLQPQPIGTEFDADDVLAIDLLRTGAAVAVHWAEAFARVMAIHDALELLNANQPSGAGVGCLRH